MQRNFFDILIIEFAKLLMPLMQLNNARRITAFVQELGWPFPGREDVDIDLSRLIELIQALTEKVETLVDTDGDDAAITLLLMSANIKEVVTEIRAITPLFESDIKREFPETTGNLREILVTRIMENLLFRYVQTYHARIFAIFNLLGLIETVVNSQGIAVKTIQWRRFGMLLNKPGKLAAQVYQWGDQEEGKLFDDAKFLNRLGIFLRAIMLPGGIYEQVEQVRERLGRLREGYEDEIRIPVFQRGVWPEDYQELDINICSLPPENEKKSGIALYPNFLGAVDIATDLSNNWKLEIKGDVNFDNGFGVQLRAPDKVKMVTDLFSENAARFIDAYIELVIKRKLPSDTLTYIFGAEESSHLAFRDVAFKCIANVQHSEEEIITELNINDLSVAINPGDGADGFIQKILSGVNIKARRDLGVGFSNKDGFYFSGSSALEATYPTHVKLGPINIESVTVGFNSGTGKYSALLGTTFSATLGPLTANIKRIGITIPIEFPDDSSGNLGPINVRSPGFLPPTGAGISLVTGPVSGGGFLEHDETNKSYAGILSLQMYDIGLVAIALISTRLPDGTKGYSLLVNIGVTFSPPIQLSFGFTLSGVGGIIGINRSMDIQVLQQGIKSRTLDSILFPDPGSVIKNATKILSDMRSVFPSTNDRYVIGPMFKIGWGTPNIITADVGIFFELPAPVRVVLMGQLEAVFPSSDKALIVINMDVLGVLDLEKEILTFQASLYDSRLLFFTMYGDAAFLLSWGNNPQFAMSMGGFHPRFTPPPPPIIFADLKRLTLAINSGKNFHLTCQAYQALTPNSLQFGARADMYVSIGDARITGYQSFDALFYFSPFSFEVAVSAGMHINYKRRSLANVTLSFVLSGPTPWNARGHARIKIAFIKVKIRFNITWGSEEKATLPTIDPLLQIKTALENPESWGTQLPVGMNAVESIRSMEEQTSSNIVVHPMGRFEVRQNVVPLAVNLHKAGNSPVSGHDYFDIEQFNVGGIITKTAPVEEFFARGQFESLSTDEQLSVPSFEKMKSGVSSIASESMLVNGNIESKTLNYESIVVQPDYLSCKCDTKGSSDWNDAQYIVAAQARERSTLRGGPRKRFLNHSKRRSVGVRNERYAIVNMADLSRATIDQSITARGGDNADMTRMQAEQMLQQQLELAPAQKNALIIVPEYEVFREAA